MWANCGCSLAFFFTISFTFPPPLSFHLCIVIEHYQKIRGAARACSERPREEMKKGRDDSFFAGCRTGGTRGMHQHPPPFCFASAIHFLWQAYILFVGFHIQGSGEGQQHGEHFPYWPPSFSRARGGLCYPPGRMGGSNVCYCCLARYALWVRERERERETRTTLC